MKKILPIISILLIICLFSGCSIFSKKTIDGTNDIIYISRDRMEELVIANNSVVNTIYGEVEFFTTAELQTHIFEFYTEETVKKYFDEDMFYDEGGKVCSLISTSNRKNISKMKYKIDYNNISLVNNTQVFSVTFSDKKAEYELNFTAKYDEKLQEWLLTDIVI